MATASVSSPSSSTGGKGAKSHVRAIVKMSCEISKPKSSKSKRKRRKKSAQNHGENLPSTSEQDPDGRRKTKPEKCSKSEKKESRRNCMNSHPEYNYIDSEVNQEEKYYDFNVSLIFNDDPGYDESLNLSSDFEEEDLNGSKVNLLMRGRHKKRSFARQIGDKVSNIILDIQRQLKINARKNSKERYIKEWDENEEIFSTFLTEVHENKKDQRLQLRKERLDMWDQNENLADTFLTNLSDGTNADFPSQCPAVTALNGPMANWSQVDVYFPIENSTFNKGCERRSNISDQCFQNAGERKDGIQDGEQHGNLADQILRVMPEWKTSAYWLNDKVLRSQALDEDQLESVDISQNQTDEKTRKTYRQELESRTKLRYTRKHTCNLL